MRPAWLCQGQLPMPGWVLGVRWWDQGGQACQSLPAQLVLLRSLCPGKGQLCIACPRCRQIPFAIWHPRRTCLQQGLEGSQGPEPLEQGALPQSSCIHWRGIQQRVEGRHQAPHERFVLRVSLKRG